MDNPISSSISLKADVMVSSPAEICPATETSHKFGNAILLGLLFCNRILPVSV